MSGSIANWGGDEGGRRKKRGHGKQKWEKEQTMEKKKNMKAKENLKRKVIREGQKGNTV